MFTLILKERPLCSISFSILLKSGGATAGELPPRLTLKAVKKQINHGPIRGSSTTVVLNYNNPVISRTVFKIMQNGTIVEQTGHQAWFLQPKSALTSSEMSTGNTALCLHNQP